MDQLNYNLLLNMMLKKSKQTVNKIQHAIVRTQLTDKNEDVYKRCVRSMTDVQIFDENASKTLRALIHQHRDDILIDSDKLRKILFKER